jgi:hypothetical protein
VVARWDFNLVRHDGANADRTEFASITDFNDLYFVSIEFSSRPPLAMISGVTRDNSGAVLGGCVVELYETATDIALFKTTSDATTGAFTFTCARFSPATHYLVAYKAGGTDVAGTSVNTLVGS